MKDVDNKRCFALEKIQKGFTFEERKTRRGFTLIEILIVISVVALGTMAVLGSYLNQIKKGFDAKRKKALNQMRTAFEDYYSDNNRYPASLACGQDLSPWMKRVPCEPDGTNYFYETNETTWFRIYTKLENEADPSIEKVGCVKVSEGGCPGNSAYNYGISGGDIRL